VASRFCGVVRPLSIRAVSKRLFVGVIAGIGVYVCAPQPPWSFRYHPLQWISLSSRNMEQSWTERYVEIQLVVPSEVVFSCIVSLPSQSLSYVSRLILRPNRAYSSTFNSCISSLIVPSFSSSAVTSPSIFSVDVESISWTSGSGRDMNESPILYLAQDISGVVGRNHPIPSYGIMSSSSASSSSFETSSRSSFSFCKTSGSQRCVIGKMFVGETHMFRFQLFF
jgi:hypothetical protein